MFYINLNTSLVAVGNKSVDLMEAPGMAVDSVMENQGFIVINCFEGNGCLGSFSLISHFFSLRLPTVRTHKS